jgi:hypothetical protein
MFSKVMQRRFDVSLPAKLGFRSANFRSVPGSCGMTILTADRHPALGDFSLFSRHKLPTPTACVGAKIAPSFLHIPKNPKNHELSDIRTVLK